MIAQTLVLKAINTIFGSALGGDGGFGAATPAAKSVMMPALPSPGTFSGVSNFSANMPTFSGLNLPKGGMPQSSGNVYVNVKNENKDNKVEVKESQRQDGSKQIDIMIKRQVSQMFGDGTMDKTMARRFGMSPKPA